MDGYTRLGLGINHSHSAHLISIQNFVLTSNGLPGDPQAVPSKGFPCSPSRAAVEPEEGLASLPLKSCGARLCFEQFCPWFY